MADDGEQTTEQTSSVPADRRLVVAGLVIGVWASLPPFVGPALTTRMSVEIVDHPVPALLVLAVTAWASWVRRASEVKLFAAGLAVILAGLWMTATHVALVVQALRGEVSWAPAISHSLPGLAVLVLGGLWTARYR